MLLTSLRARGLRHSCGKYDLRNGENKTDNNLPIFPAVDYRDALMPIALYSLFYVFILVSASLLV